MSTRAQIEFYDEFGTLAARIYQHSDGYPEGIIPRLHYVEKLLSQSLPSYGPRSDDAEWVAAEFVSQFRLPSDVKLPAQKNSWDPIPLESGVVKKGLIQRYRGMIYITNDLHPDIQYLYRVTCKASGWLIQIVDPSFANEEPYALTGEKIVTHLYNEKTGKELKQAVVA